MAEGEGCDDGVETSSADLRARRFRRRRWGHRSCCGWRTVRFIV